MRTFVALLLLVPHGQEATPEGLPKVPPGWKVEIVARSPVIRHPTVVACAPDGRVFVAEDPMDISAPADKPLGRVLCFHPDGRVTVFAENLYAPFGMQYLEGRLYVLHNPKFSRFTDDHGVGRDRVDLIASTNPKPWALDWNDHVPSNFKLSMDGFFYMSVGDKGLFVPRDAEGRRVALHGGGLVRLRPDATGLEILCSGTRNTLDVVLDAEDELFTYDNTDEHHWMSRLTHMVEGGFYGYPWDFVPRRPYTLWMMADYGPGAATATLGYNEDALPQEYRGNFFLADFGKRAVFRVRVARDGATFKALSHEDFITNGEKDDFRPVGIAPAPDGMSFYVGCWNHSDSKANVSAGRLLKISWTGKSLAAPKPAWYVPAAMGKKFDASAEDLIQALSHASRDVRLTAQRRLSDLGPTPIGLLVELLSDAKASAAARRHAIWALDAIDGGREAILAATRDKETSVRLQAARQLGFRRAKEAKDLFVALLHDADPAMRLRAAIGLGRLADRSTVPGLLEALGEKDFVVRYSIFTALNRIGRADPAAWPAIAGGLKSGRESVREGALLAMREVYEEPVVAALSAEARDKARDASLRAAALKTLAELHRRDKPWNGEWWDAWAKVSPYHPALAPRSIKSVEWAGTRAVLEALAGGLGDPEAPVRRAAVAGLSDAREVAAAPKLRELFGREKDLEVKRAILRALGKFKDVEAKDLVAGALDPKGDPALFADAADVAVEVGARDAVIVFLEARPSHQEGLLAAISALAQMGGESAVGPILPLVEDPGVEIRKAAIAALGKLKSRKAVTALNGAFLREETRSEAADALSRVPDPRALDAYLFGLGGANAGLRDRCAGAIGSIKEAALPLIEKRLEAGPLPMAVVGELQKIYAKQKPESLFRIKVTKLDPEAYLDFALKNAGDAARGRALFSDPKGPACAKCHMPSGLDAGRNKVGPDLTTIGAQFSRKDLAESVLYPSRRVREGYQQTIVLTKGGDIVAGVAREETAEELTLVDGEGNLHRLRKGRIEQRKSSALSLMPDGLSTGLSLQDFADIIGYLESLKTKP